MSLHNDGLPLPDFDLSDACGQRERFVDVDAPRIVGRLRVVRDELLEERLRYRDAGDRRRLKLEPALSILRAQDATDRDRQAAAEEIPGIDQRARALRLGDRVEIDGCGAADFAIADD